jgi:hypothetical protein
MKAGFNERCSCRNATSNPFLQRTIRPQSYQSGSWILAIPLFQWSLKGSKLISIHIRLRGAYERPCDNCKIVSRVTDLHALPVHHSDLTMSPNVDEQIMGSKSSYKKCVTSTVGRITKRTIP